VEDIPFDRIRPAKATAQEKKFTDMQAALQSADKQTIVGRWDLKHSNCMHSCTADANKPALV
jgi:hypothetical protein